jgi:hypothetical protein
MEVEIIVLGENREEKSNEGLSASIQAASEHRCNITVIVGSKDKYPMKLIQYFLTETEAEHLKKKEKIVLNNGSVLELESTHTIAKAPITPVLFLVYGWAEVIPKIKKAVGVKKLIVLAPNEEQASIWEKEFA